jgi:hypothetical protein
MPRINLTSVLVDDQEKALRFYTEVLGFVKKSDIPLGEARWLTVVSPQDPDGPELVLEVNAEYGRLRDLGVRFTQKPFDAGSVVMAVLDDTCGNLIQLATTK